MKVGLFGGSFDPIHKGHLAVASAARAREALDRVLFVPAANPPHKEGRPMTEAAHRLAMVRLALEGRAGFEASDIEIRRQGLSYTVDTLAEIRASSPPGTEVYLVIGSDTLADLPHWREVKKIVASTPVLTVLRQGFTPSVYATLLMTFTAEEVKRLAFGFIEIDPVEVSATDIRERVRKGLPIDGLVPAGVAAYIAKHRIYRA